jgi:magnesium transporter
MARTRLYRNGVLEKENFPVSEISECVNDAGAVVWLDLCAADGEGLSEIEEEFGLHALAVEDAAHERQRPKLDHYSTHLFLSAYSVALDPESDELTSSEIAMFVMHNALITVRKDRVFDMDQVVTRWDATPELVKEGAGFLLYGVLDFIVDGHFTAVQSLDERIDALEEELFDDTRDRVRDIQRKSFDLRKSLVMLRRFVLPMREVVNGLMRRELNVVSDSLMPY